jgi:CheY-like chemotaxis protein
LILIVEDEENVRASMTELLTLHGYDVITAQNGVEALEIYTDDIRPDLIISDILMPEMDGLSYTRS